MAKRGFGTVRNRLNQNLQGGGGAGVVTSKSTMCHKGKFSWRNDSVGVYS